VIARDTASPYVASWNSRKGGPGTHTIKARALDSAGRSAEQSVSVTVK